MFTVCVGLMFCSKCMQFLVICSLQHNININTVEVDPHTRCICSGDTEALERIAYEFCEDKANGGVLYCETRYCPHLLANCGVDGVQCNRNKEQNCSPRNVVESVCNGLERGCRDFGVKVRTILCCMRHRPGKIRNQF